MTRWHRDIGAGGGMEERPLRVLDPETTDPGYWARLHRRILGAAAPELARRRALRDLTVGDVMSSWARTVVPTALLAAVMAGLLLLHDGGSPTTEVASADVEEALLEGLEDSGLSAFAADGEGDPGTIMFAGESF